MIGRQLAHYQIIEKLGEGGMGVVYKARDSHLDRFVAIKVLPTEKVADTLRRARFVLEAKAASALNHPNIVHIYDISSDDGTDFIAMEHVTGKTLDHLIQRKGMRLSEALKIGVQVADALCRAHAAGIVHRDIKPSNVMVTDEGVVKVLDFGLAKLTERDSGCDADAETATIGAAPKPRTQEGAILGTAAYMSPEQAEGRPVDARSDNFSFGAVLYEMVTGQKAFRGDSLLSTINRIVNENPRPPSEINTSIPNELDKIVLRCLRKDRTRRYQTMADLKVALEDVEAEPAVAEPRVLRRVRLSYRWTAIGLTVVAAALASIGLRWFRVPVRAAAVRAVALTTFPGEELYPSFSPDGNHVAFTWNGPHQVNTDIYVQQIGAGSPLRLTTHPAPDYNPVWSPDGRWIAFLRGADARNELRLVAPLGGPERKVTDLQLPETYFAPAYLTWSPDGKLLVVTDSAPGGQPSALFAVSPESGEKRQLTNPKPPALADSHPAVSPDGHSLVFRRNLTAAVGELYWVRLGEDATAKGEASRLTAATNASYPMWISDKEILYSTTENLWRLTVPGDHRPARLPFIGEDGLMPAISRPLPDRPPRLAYVRSLADWSIWSVETAAPGAPASTAPAPFISSTRLDDSPQFSPDGRRVAFNSNRSGSREIWLTDADGSNTTQLTSMAAYDTGTPRWSPNGEMIAFDSNVEGQYEIYAISASGGKPRRITFHSASDHIPSFSRDGKWIYFTSNRTGAHEIWRVAAAGGEPVQVTTNTGWIAFESPDGASVYYTQTVGPPSPLLRVPSSGGRSSRVVDHVVMRAFAVIERGIYYIDRPGSETRLRFLDFASGRSTTVVGNLGEVRFGLTASPDGRRVLFSRLEVSLADVMLVENFQ